ncbi:MAG: peroxidase family protein [Rubrimonas sp.]
MPLTLFRPILPDSLRPDARDARLPLRPAHGFRNIMHDGEAPEALRWRGLGHSAETEVMLALLAERMMSAAPRNVSAPFAAGYTYLAQFMAHDLQFSTDETVYPGGATPFPPLHKRRLMLETIYGDGPEQDPEFYGEGCDALARWRLRVGAFGPGVSPGQRTLPRRRHEGCSADPNTPLCAADDRNDENPVVAQIAGFFMRLHNVALRRLNRYDPGPERFAAAQRVTRAIYRRIVFDDLLVRLLREDVRSRFEQGARIDARALTDDDAPVEFTHAVFRAGHALVRADYAINDNVNAGRAVNVQYMIRHTSRRDAATFDHGAGWPIDWSRFFGERAQGAQGFGPHVNAFLAEAPGILSADYPRARRAHLILRDLVRGMDAGVMRVEPLGEAIRPLFEGEPGLERWLALDESHRGRAVLDWIANDRALRAYSRDLCAEPPLYFFTLLEAGSPWEQGGGGGKCFGALGSAIMADLLFAARAASRAKVEEHPELGRDIEDTLGEDCGLNSMARLIAVLTRRA